MYFPLIVDLSGWKIVVFGGGRVAERRIRTLMEQSAPSLDFEAVSPEILVVSPDCKDSLRQWIQGQPGVRWIADRYREKYLNGARLVIAAASDPDVNAQIVEACSSLGILWNDISRDTSSVLFPAVASSSGLGRFATTYGRYPKLIKRWRNAEKESFWNRFDRQHMDELSRWRALVLQTEADTDEKQQKLEQALEWNAEKLRGEIAALEKRIGAREE